MNHKELLLLSTIFLAISACQSQVQSNAPTSSPQPPKPSEGTPLAGLSSDPFSYDWEDFSVYEAGLIKEAHSVLISLSENPIYHLDLTIASSLDSISGVAVIRYINQEDTPLNQLFLHLYPNITGGEMTIKELSLDGTPIDGSLVAGNSALQITLPQSLEPGTQTEIGMSYDLQLPLEMSGNYGLFGSFDGLLVLQEIYPILPVFDADGWDIDLPAKHGDLIHIDASFYLVRITLPSKLQVVSSGVELDRGVQGDWQSITIAAGPARDFYLAAAEDFQPTTTTLGGTKITSYTLPSAESYADASMQITKAAISSYSQRLVNYPYTEFDLISTPMQALGMEYPGMTALNVNMFDPEATISDLPGTYFLEATIAHEVAHQWFYNMVGNDQVDEPWLDEAIVQYLTGIYFLDQYGVRGYSDFRQSWLDRWDRVDMQPTPIGLPAADYDAQAYGAVVYGRGPLFIEALAEEMGEDVFWSFLQTYTNELAWKISQPDKFMAMAEESCGCDLSELWETWGISP
jgi:hypothetical protein